MIIDPCLPRSGAKDIVGVGYSVQCVPTEYRGTKYLTSLTTHTYSHVLLKRFYLCRTYMYVRLCPGKIVLEIKSIRRYER